MTNPAALKFVSNAGPASRRWDEHISEYVYNVKSFGAVGNGSNDDTGAIQACLDAAITDNNNVFWSFSNLTRHVYFPPGIYNTIAPLTIGTNKHGGIISGAGKGVSVINNITSGSKVIATDGYMNGTLRDITLKSAGGAGSICYHWDAAFGSGSASKENVWSNVEFIGGERGLMPGPYGQCDVTWLKNCTFRDQTIAGIDIQSDNALQWPIMGGRFENCGVGIKAGAGNVPLVRGVCFANNAVTDIQNTRHHTLTVIGCYFDSPASGGSIVTIGPTKIIACEHIRTGVFVAVGSSDMTPAGTVIACLDGCVSANGTFQDFNGDGIHSNVTKIYLRNCNCPMFPGSYSGTQGENY